jgi:hypothetical protein
LAGSSLRFTRALSNEHDRDNRRSKGDGFWSDLFVVHGDGERQNDERLQQRELSDVRNASHRQRGVEDEERGVLDDEPT